MSVRTRVIVRAAVCLAALLAVLAPVGSARAAQPVAGGKYVADCCADDANFLYYAVVSKLRGLCARFFLRLS